MRSAANSIWRIAWTRICCVLAVSGTIQLGSFSVTSPSVETVYVQASFAACPIASGSRACALRSGLPPLARRHAGLRPRVSLQAALGNFFFCLGFWTRHWHRPTQRSLRRGGWLIRRLWLRAWRSAPGSIRTSETTRPRVSWQTRRIAVAIEQGFPHWRAQGTMCRGWAEIKNGEVTKGISLLRGGSAAFRATGRSSGRRNILALLATAYEITGQIEEALTLLDEAFQIVERTGERWF